MCACTIHTLVYDAKYLTLTEHFKPCHLICSVSRSAGKVYHVLIFHKGGQYSLDIAGAEGSPASFPSLDDLVVFCMSHQMKMEGDEVERFFCSCVQMTCVILIVFTLTCVCVCVCVCVKDSNNNTVDMMMYLLIVYTCIYVHVCVCQGPQ